MKVRPNFNKDDREAFQVSDFRFRASSKLLTYFSYLFILIIISFNLSCGQKESSLPVREERIQKDVSSEEASFKELTTAGNVLRMYTALDTNEAKIYIKEFEKDTGIDVKWVRLSSGEILTRLRNEKNNPQVGLWFGGPSVDFISAKEEGLLSPYKPNVDFKLLEGTYDEDFYWVGFYFGGIGFASNTEILKRRGLKPPTSWYDLIKPEFKGEIGVAYAYTSGTSYTILATLVQLMGEESAFSYIKKLNENIHHYNKSGSACVTQVGLGEIGVGIAFSHDILKKGTAAGYPVVLTFPEEGTGYEIGAMALVKGGPGHSLAKKFIDWALGVRCQNLMKRWYRIPINPKAEIVAGAVRAEDMRLIKFDAVKAGKEKRRLIERWREITRQ